VLEIGELTRTEMVSLRAGLSSARTTSAPHLLDTTMLYGPRSGGVKRYLLANTTGWPASGRTCVIPWSSPAV
jgi:hypothetical protein